MKFCKHCGNQIPDNAVCNCPGAVAERQSQGGYQQQGYQQQGYPQGGYQQPMYGAPRQAGPNPMSGLAAALSGYFKSPLRTVRDRQRAKDFITPLIILGTIFMLLWGVNSCIYGNTAVVAHTKINNFSIADGLATGTKKAEDIYKFNFGFVILASLIETLTMAACYIGAKFLVALIFVKPIDPGKFFFDALISFGVNSIVPLSAMVVGGLFYMALGALGQVFFGFALIWYIFAFLIETFDEVPAEKKNFGFYIAVVGIVALAAFGYIMMYKLMCYMSMGGKTVEDCLGIRKAYLKMKYPKN